MMELRDEEKFLLMGLEFGEKFWAQTKFVKLNIDCFIGFMGLFGVDCFAGKIAGLSNGKNYGSDDKRVSK